MRRLPAYLGFVVSLVAALTLTGGCGDSVDESGDVGTTTSPPTTDPVETTSSTEPPPPATTASVDADYEFALSVPAEQLRPSDAFGPHTVYPLESLRLDFTNTGGPDNPCPTEPDIEVTDADWHVVFSATGFAVELADEDLTGPLTFTARCERGAEIGIGTWGPVEVLGLLDLSLGSAGVEPGENVDVVVEGGCPGGSAAIVDLLEAEGAWLGISTTLGVDGRGSLNIPPQLFPQTLFVRAECRDATDPAIAFAELVLSSDRIEPVSDLIEYQPGVFLSLFEPALCDGSLRPVMITTGPGDAAEFAERGYVGVIVEARNPGNTGRVDTEMIQAIGSATNDLAIAVQWLRANAAQYCIEPDAIAAMGHSFWGITALALAYSEGELVEGELITLDEFGASATVGAPHPGPPAEIADFSNDINAAVSFSGFALADQIDAGEPPAILFHGRNDSTVPFALAEKTCQAATAVGVTCELIPHDSGHGRADDIDVAWDTIAKFLEREMLAPAGITVQTS